MSEEEVDEFLVEQGHGTFSVASDERAYSVPISVGYDGDLLYMNLIQFGQDSKKLEYLRNTEEACVVLTDVNDRFDWRSVVVTGTTSEVSDDDEERHEEVLNDNGWFPTIFPPEEPITNVTRIVLEPTERTGRKGEKHQG